MSIRKLFQKTQKQPAALKYDDLPNEFRVQVINIWERLFAKHLIIAYPDTFRMRAVPEFFSEAIIKEVAEAHGVFINAHWGHNDFGALANYFLKLSNIERALQVIQIAFGFVEEQMRPLLPQYHQLGCQDIDEAISNLNHRFLQHGIGYQYHKGDIIKIDALPAAHQSREQIGADTTMKVFVSHSGTEQALAEAFVNLIKPALRLAAKDIRCTSVDGYRLPAGSDVGEQLRQEVFESEVFVALLSPTSSTSVFVTFELGARWGAKRPLMPVLVRGLTARDLKAPLSAIHAVSGTEQGQLHQLLEDIARALGLELEPASAYQAHLETFRKAAQSVP